MAWYTFWRKSEPEPEKPKLKICCACPETKAGWAKEAPCMDLWPLSCPGTGPGSA